jgi:hypothetical protein
VRRAVGAVAALLLAVVAGLVVTAPAAAAVPDPLFIQNAWTARCLDQHYAPGPTTTVYSYPCHYQDNPPGNQQWGLVRVPNSNYFRIINHRSGWCLSEPNAHFTRIYAESCQSWLPPKQLWLQEATPDEFGLLINAFTGRCMQEVYLAGKGHGDMAGMDCDVARTYIDARGQWHWQPYPW